jgi:hypothetical protein
MDGAERNPAGQVLASRSLAKAIYPFAFEAD